MHKISPHRWGYIHFTRKIYIYAIHKAGGYREDFKGKNAVNIYRNLYGWEFKEINPLDMRNFEKYTPLVIDDFKVYLNGIQYNNMQEIANELHFMARRKYKVKECEYLGIKVYSEQFGKPKIWKLLNRFCEHLKSQITYTFNGSEHYYYAGINKPTESYLENLKNNFYNEQF